MTLEKLLEALIEALTANTEALAAAPKKASTRKSVDDEEEEEAPKRKAPTKKRNRVAKKPTKQKAVDLTDVKTVFSEFLADAEGKDDTAARKKEISKIANAFKIKQIRDLDPDDYQDALDMLAEAAQRFAEGDEEEGEEEDAQLI